MSHTARSRCGLLLAVLLASGLDPSPALPAWHDAATPPLNDAGHGDTVAWGDYDNDGDLDLYLTNNGLNKLFRNDGGGVFADATTAVLGDDGFAQGAPWGDYDNDGDLDLYLVNYYSTGNKLFRNDGGGAFGDVTAAPLNYYGPAINGIWIDHDNDGDLDIYMAVQSGPNRLFRNDTGGVFVDATTAPLDYAGPSIRLGAGDYDDDGDADIFVSCNGPYDKLFRNDGSGHFADVTTGPLGGREEGAGRTPAWGDYDNDGDLDIFVANGYRGELLRNDGNGVFTDATSGALADSINSADAAWGDYDNDGDLDLYLSEWSSPDHFPNQLFRNDGGGDFTDVTPAPLNVVGLGNGVAWGDYDGDGDLDLYWVNHGFPNKLFRNDGEAAGSHWLHVNLVGTLSNRAAIGARVRLVAGALSQIREVSGGEGVSQNALTAAFGLGSATTIDSLIVRWPSGLVQVVEPPPTVDAVVTVREPSVTPLEYSGLCADPRGRAVQLRWFSSIRQGFDVYRAEGPGYACSRISGAPVHGRGELSYLDTTVRPSTSYWYRLGFVDVTGRRVMSDPVSVTTGAWEDERAQLTSVGPNPARGDVVVHFSMPREGWACLGVYDAAARLIRVLCEGPQEEGDHTLTWSGHDARGNRVSSGVYFVRMTDGRATEERRIVLLR